MPNLKSDGHLDAATCAGAGPLHGNLRAWMNDADSALYRAKTEERNQISGTTTLAERPAPTRPENLCPCGFHWLRLLKITSVLMAEKTTVCENIHRPCKTDLSTHSAHSESSLHATGGSKNHASALDGLIWHEVENPILPA
ncbi:hypothetical protein GALL_321160 [mine drainage metagenome]|uniref:Uncharacterized protein n=1 Tax=mine drainage metagenome TaxID=410659 RepID=A0A1J5QRM2_9ZZZZ